MPFALITAAAAGVRRKSSSDFASLGLTRVAADALRRSNFAMNPTPASRCSAVAGYRGRSAHGGRRVGFHRGQVIEPHIL